MIHNSQGVQKCTLYFQSNYNTFYNLFFQLFINFPLFLSYCVLCVLLNGMQIINQSLSYQFDQISIQMELFSQE